MTTMDRRIAVVSDLASDLSPITERLNSHKASFEELNRKVIRVSGEGPLTLIQRLVSHIPLSFLRNKVEDVILDGHDGLEVFENLMRRQLLDIQGVIEMLGEVASSQRSTINQLSDDVQRAEEEEWLLEEIEEYILGRLEDNGIPVSENIRRLIKQVHEDSDEEQQTTVRNRLFVELREDVALGEQFIEYLQVMERAGASFFMSASQQYLRFATIRAPLSAARDAAQELTGVHLVGVVSEGVVRQTTQLTVMALEDIIDSTSASQNDETRFTACTSTKYNPVSQGASRRTFQEIGSR